MIDTKTNYTKPSELNRHVTKDSQHRDQSAKRQAPTERWVHGHTAKPPGQTSKSKTLRPDTSATASH